jgi:hypothetical protein
MGKISFDDIRNKEKGKIGIVCGTGGSLKDYHDEFVVLSKNQKDKYCFISCNEWHQKTKLDVDYWVVANSVFTVSSNYDLFNSRQNTTLIYADSADVNSKSFEGELKINFIPYDERHFNEQKCFIVKDCCKNIEHGRKTIQEYLQQISNHDKAYNSCGTVGIHMIAVAVILGCSPIYVSGIDMDYSTGYADGLPENTRHGDIGEFHGEFGIQSGVISDSALKMGIEIINLSKFATYGGIKKGEFRRM